MAKPGSLLARLFARPDPSAPVVVNPGEPLPFEALRREFSSSGLPVRAWFASVVKRLDAAQVDRLMILWPETDDLKHLDMAEIVVQHAPASSASEIPLSFVALQGDLPRLAVALSRLSPSQRGFVFGRLGRRLLNSAGDHDEARDLMLQLLANGGYTMTAGDREPLFSLYGASMVVTRPKFVDLPPDIAAPASSRLRQVHDEIASQMKWDDASVWSSLLLSRSKDAARIYAWLDRGVLRCGDPNVRPPDNTTFHATAVGCMSNTFDRAPTPLLADLARIWHTPSRRYLDCLLEQLSAGEPAEDMIKPLAAVAPEVVRSLRLWCYTPSADLRPVLSDLASQRGQWQQILEALDKECGITDPSVATPVLPRPVEPEIASSLVAPSLPARAYR